jgi:hypothetical protein
MKIYTIGDSHSIVYDKSDLVENYFWLGGMTMHRVGTQLINFNNVECDPLGWGKEIKSVPTDGIVIASFGEIDVRNHIYKQVCMGRNEDEILCTLVNNYIEALKLNNIKYKYIACASIAPVRKDFENEHIPVKGTNEDRLRYTLKLNYLLNLELPKHGFYFLNLYPYYCNSDGYLIDDDNYRDNSVHLKHSKYMDEQLKKMIEHFKNTEIIGGFYKDNKISLHELGLKYNTNKASYHNYCKFYDKLLSSIRDSCKNMLEVGISDGASILMWREYFKDATIYGIDIEQKYLINNEERIISGLADQSNVDTLIKLIESWSTPEFDFIIDDGSHIVSHQQNTINTLWKYVKKGGIYIIEDLHTNIVENFYTHPHLNPSILLKYLDSPKTVHNNIVESFSGNSSFSFNDEIEDIYYFYNQPTKSLSCVFVKKA